MQVEIQAMAKKAYRLSPKMKNSIDVTLTMTLHNIEFFKSQVNKLDKAIAQEIAAIPQI